MNSFICILVQFQLIWFNLIQSREYTLKKQSRFYQSPTTSKQKEQFFIDPDLTPTDWDGAAAICERYGGELASIIDESEQNAAISLCRKTDIDAQLPTQPGIAQCWIGLMDTSADGLGEENEWLDYSPTCYGFEDGNPTINRLPWGPGQPDNKDVPEACTAIFAKLEPSASIAESWFDRPCTAADGGDYVNGIALCRRKCKAGSSCSCLFGAKITADPYKEIMTDKQRLCCNYCQKRKNCNSFDFDRNNNKCRLFYNRFSECVLESAEGFVAGEIIERTDTITVKARLSNNFGSSNANNEEVNVINKDIVDNGYHINYNDINFLLIVGLVTGNIAVCSYCMHSRRQPLKHIDVIDE